MCHLDLVDTESRLRCDHIDLMRIRARFKTVEFDSEDLLDNRMIWWTEVKV